MQLDSYLEGNVSVNDGGQERKSGLVMGRCGFGCRTYIITQENPISRLVNHTHYNDSVRSWVSEVVQTPSTRTAFSDGADGQNERKDERCNARFSPFVISPR